jgi:hypothetical protein
VYVRTVTLPAPSRPWHRQFGRAPGQSQQGAQLPKPGHQFQKKKKKRPATTRRKAAHAGAQSPHVPRQCVAWGLTVRVQLALAGVGLCGAKERLGLVKERLDISTDGRRCFIGVLVLVCIILISGVRDLASLSFDHQSFSS